MDEKNPEYEQELKRRVSIMTGDGSGDSPIKGLNGFDYAMIVLLIVLSFIIFYFGWL